MGIALKAHKAGRMAGKQKEYGFLVGVGGIGSGMFFALRGNRA